MRGQATGGEAGFNLRARTVHQHQAHAEAVQQDDVVDDVAEIRMLHAVARQHDDEGAVAVGIDVRRRVTKPIDVFGHEPGPVINSSRKKGETENAQRADGYRRNRLGDTRALLMNTGWDIGNLTAKPCRSELARDGYEGTELIQAALVIVNVHREQARSYTGVRQ
ncbi:hypothetical protein D3C86_1487380 [compost metagenome]